MRVRFAIALTLTAAVPSTAQATWAGHARHIIWADPVIHTIRPDGTHARDLRTRGFGLSVSRGGSWIAYLAYRSVWRIGVDGKHRTRILRLKPPYDSAEDTAWSPTGRRLSFDTLREVGEEDTDSFHTLHEIWVVGRDGRGLRKVAKGSEAVWSRDGRFLLYCEEDGDVARIRPSGRGHRTLYHQGGGCLDLDLSPDGRRLAYEFLPDGGGFRIRTLDLKRRRLVGSFRTRYGTKVNAADLAWAPRGRRIAFIHWGKGTNNDSVRTVRPSGTHVRTLFRIPPAPKGVFPSNDDLAWQTR